MSRFLRVVGSALCCFLLVGAGSPAWGQEEAPRFGITLGLNRASLSAPDAAVTPSARYVATGGVVAHVWRADPVSVQAELLLSQKGATLDSDQSTGLQYGAGYIELPVLLNAEAPSLGPVTPYALAGGFGGVKVFERQQPAEGDLNISLDTGESFFRRFDAGVMAGLGGHIRLGEQRLNLVVRRSWGLVDVADPPDTLDDPFFSDTPAFPASATTRTWSLLLRLGI
jgi:hypothetical protein